MVAWMSLFWAWLLPALAALPALTKLIYLIRARRRDLIRRRGWRWLLAGLAAAQALIWLTMRAVVFPADPWLPLAGLLAVGVMVAALRAAGPDVHAGLRGLQRAIPADGLALIARELTRRRGRGRWVAPLLPALILITLVLIQQPQRWLALIALAVTLAAPALLVTGRWRAWLPIGLAPALAVLASQAWLLRAELPSGAWAWPVTGARCAGPMRLAPPAAWCLNVRAAVIYRFDLASGVVTLAARVPEVARIVAATPERAWVQQVPTRGLVSVPPDAKERVPFGSAASGAMDAGGRLWVIDVGQELTLYEDGLGRAMRSTDGLLNNTANVVKAAPDGTLWVGSISGVSWLRPDTGEWQRLGRETGLPGAVTNLAFGSDGQVWLMWQRRLGYVRPHEWGVSAMSPDGSLRHYELGLASGLEAPAGDAALATDARGRLWLVSQSIIRRERFLVVAEISAEIATEIYSLGGFPTAGLYAYGTGLWPESHAVMSDGAGGITLYSGETEPWLRWRP